MGVSIRLVGGTEVQESNRRIRRQSNQQPAAQRGVRDLLNDRKIAAWIKAGMIGSLKDGGALYLVGRDRGYASWQVPYRSPQSKKENTYTIGRYGAGADEFTLAQAREERDQVKKWLALGLDPAIERRATKARTTGQQGETFEVVANEWYEKAKREWTSQKHIRERRRCLDQDLLPKLGPLPIRGLTAPAALAALQLIEERGAFEQAAKAKSVGSMICKYAIVTGRIQTSPFQHLGQALTRPPVKNRATVGTGEMPTLFKALAAVPAELSTKLALYFQIATAVRPGEVRFAPWSEIEGKAWRIPAGRMKMREPFVQPLSPLALRILARARELRQTNEPTELIFPGFTGSGHLSENAFTALLARCGFYGRQTAHGFRASFSTWAHEREFDSAAVELCLAHRPEGVKGVYDRGQRMESRLRILTAWAKQLETWGLRLPESARS